MYSSLFVKSIQIKTWALINLLSFTEIMVCAVNVYCEEWLEMYIAMLRKGESHLYIVWLFQHVLRN